MSAVRPTIAISNQIQQIPQTFLDSFCQTFDNQKQRCSLELARLIRDDYIKCYTHGYNMQNISEYWLKKLQGLEPDFTTQNDNYRIGTRTGKYELNTVKCIVGEIKKKVYDSFNQGGFQMSKDQYFVTDFRQRFATEVKIRQPVSVDVNNLKNLINEFGNSNDIDLLLIHLMCISGFRQVEIFQSIQLDSITVEGDVIMFKGLAKNHDKDKLFTRYILFNKAPLIKEMI